jgi:hypothetical protein
MSAVSQPSKAQEKVRVLSLRGAPKEFKIALLRELGYGVEGNHILTADGGRYVDPFSGVEVSMENMVILPGRSPPVILDDSPLSLAWYMDQYGDIF